MKVLHVIPSLDPKDGGPTFAVKAVAQALAGEGVEVTITTTHVASDRGTRDHAQQDSCEMSCLQSSAYSVVSFPRTLEAYKVSFRLAKWLRQNVKKFDLLHIHALFSFSSTMAARIARRNGVPYIVRPLGVLNRWGMENRRRLLKAISFRLIELPILLDGAAIHFTSEAERGEAAELSHKIAQCPWEVIPLPVVLPRSVIKYQSSVNRDAETTGPQTTHRETEGVVADDAESATWASHVPVTVFHERYPELENRKLILFLSRIDRKKGLELLLDAFAIVREKNADVVLVIAGDGDGAYARQLRERTSQTRGPQDNRTMGPQTQAGIQRSEDGSQWLVVSDQWSHGEAVLWTGHLSGEMKAAALAAADVFVLPSASENFGIAAAEALAAGVPTIVSEQVALSRDIRQYDAGLVVRRDITELAGAIGDLLSDTERAAVLAANGRRLIEERYSPETIGNALHALYRRVLGKREEESRKKIEDCR